MSAEPERPPLLVVLGPTASGKSVLAEGLAERLGGEIVGCDALQVYRGFDVATAKPTPLVRQRIPHHLVDHVDPARDYTLADWVREAECAIAGIAARNAVPIVVGGTGLYLRGLLRGVIEAPARDPELRQRLRRVAERRGRAALHRWLARVDPESAERIAPGDAQRVVRALELALGGGERWSTVLAREGTWGRTSERYPSLKLGLELPRELLAPRIESRVAGYFEAGLVDEVAGLLARVPRQANAFKALGYREVKTALEAGTDPTQAAALVARNTRRYAKRQRTWFRSEPGVIWLDARSAAARQVEAAAELWRERFGPR